MFRRAPSIAFTGVLASAPESLLTRSAPAAVLIAPDDTLAMTSGRGLDLLRESAGQSASGLEPDVAFQTFRTHVRVLRRAIATASAPVVQISEGLCCRGTLLRGELGEYLLILFETARRDSAQEQLARYGLTPRELEVAALLIEGLSNREIVDRLSVTENTVESHIKRILTKAHVPSRAALVSKVLGRGMN